MYNLDLDLDLDLDRNHSGIGIILKMAEGPGNVRTIEVLG